MTKEDVDKELRGLLRTAIDGLRALEKFCDPTDGFAVQHNAVGHALEYLEDDFPEDVAGKCESCFTLCLYGEMGHQTEDVCFCAACAPTWDDIKDQWEDGNREETEDGQRARFLDAYKAHVASGGTGTDRVLYQF